MTRIFLTTAFLFMGSAHARALPEYPEELQKVSGAPCLPHCNVCHRDDNAGSGTVDRPFSRSMEAIGGLDGDERSIQRALDALAQAKTDSDGDGVTDVEELAAGEDPNDAYETRLCGPQAGCALGGSDESVAPVMGVLALLTLRRRRRR